MHITGCPGCGTELTGVTNICSSVLCLYDGCPACRDYREECFAEELIKNVHEEAQKGRAQGYTDAQAMVYAVSEVLGAESGSAPIYPVTTRALEQWNRTTERAGEDRERTWTFHDGSAAVPDDRQGIWLEARE